MFTPYTHRGPANPWRASARVTPPKGQSAFTVLLRRQSERGGSGAAAVSLRADGVGRAGLCGRRCLARGVRLDPSCTAGFRRARRPRLRGRELAPTGPGLGPRSGGSRRSVSPGVGRGLCGPPAPLRRAAVRSGKGRGPALWGPLDRAWSPPAGPPLSCPGNRSLSSGLFLCSPAKQPPPPPPQYLMRLPSPRARHHPGSGRARADFGFSLRSPDFSLLAFMFHKPPVCFCGVLFRSPRFPKRTFPFKQRLLFSARVLGGILHTFKAMVAVHRAAGKCLWAPAERWHREVRGRSARPCSSALCGLSLFICEPDLPMRGGGGCWEREKV